MELPGRTFIARHGETVFNAVARMQGQMHVHTPLTARGFAQADAMGRDLAGWLGSDPVTLTLWSSTAGRALQTLAIVAEQIGADWHQVRTDERLHEIDVGEWSGRSYAEIMAEQGAIIDPHVSLFSVRPPGGEWYDEIATRLRAWVADAAAIPGDRLVIMHGMSSRVLRGVMLRLPDDPRWNAPVAGSLPQGTMVVIENGREQVIA